MSLFYLKGDFAVMKVRKVLSGSFWLIMLIHVVAFTFVGLFTTRGWRQLVLFLSLLFLLLFCRWLLTLYAVRYAEKHRFAAYLTALRKKDE